MYNLEIAKAKQKRFQMEMLKLETLKAGGTPKKWVHDNIVKQLNGEVNPTEWKTREKHLHKIAQRNAQIHRCDIGKSVSMLMSWFPLILDKHSFIFHMLVSKKNLKLNFTNIPKEIPDEIDKLMQNF